MANKRTYAILTTDSNRIEVKAYNLDDAYRQARKQLLEHINKLKETEKINPKDYERMKGWVSENSNLTSQYMTFGRDGVNYNGFIITDGSLKLYSKYKL